MKLILVVSTLLYLAKGHVHHHHRHLMAEEEDVDDIDTRCGTTKYMEEQIALDPTYQDRLDEFEDFWSTRQSEIASGEYKNERRQVTLPVVFHILYNTNSQNVADSVIAFQLAVLQDDYAGTNSDVNDPRASEFQSVKAGDMEIRYTNDQVIRKSTSVSSFGTNNNIKYDSTGGSSVVSPNSKLNFWSGQLSGGLLGYAQFPGGNVNTDGVVNLWSSMAPGLGTNNYDLGRTATHEIGHWLNLRHIWGDNSNCVTNDFVDDTPPQSGANSGCPNSFPKRCSQNPYSQDMGFNYMDYSYDACLIIFTQGQTERAWASIDQYRGGFNPSNIQIADKEYVNWLYFRIFDEEQTDHDDICYGDHILFYDNNINEDTESNVYIYGCLLKTNSMNVGHVTDIVFITDSDECNDGYTRASQDLNQGNDGEIYLCYSKEESDDIHDNMAVLDITFIKDDDTSKLDENDWDINHKVNVNPNGVKLNFAVKKGEYYSESATVESSSPRGVNHHGLETNEAVYLSIGVAVFIFVSFFIGFALWRYVCSNKEFKENMNQALNDADQYGATTEMAKIQVK